MSDRLPHVTLGNAESNLIDYTRPDDGTYTPISSESFHWGRLKACPVCSTVVIDQDLHDQWHFNLYKQILG